MKKQIKNFVCFYPSITERRKPNMDTKCAAAIIAHELQCRKPTSFVECNLEMQLVEAAAQFPFGRIPNDADTIILIGYAFNSETAYVLDEIKKQHPEATLLWFDHHISSRQLETMRPAYGTIPGYRYDEKTNKGYQSIAMLVYMYFSKYSEIEIPKFIIRIAEAEHIRMVASRSTSSNVMDGKLLINGLMSVPTAPLDNVWEQLFSDTTNQAVERYITERGAVICDYKNELKKVRGAG